MSGEPQSDMSLSEKPGSKPAIEGFPPSVSGVVALELSVGVARNISCDLWVVEAIEDVVACDAILSFG